MFVEFMSILIDKSRDNFDFIDFGRKLMCSKKASQVLHYYWNDRETKFSRCALALL